MPRPSAPIATAANSRSFRSSRSAYRVSRREILEPAGAARVAAPLLDLIEPAELQPGGAAGVLDALSFGDEVVDAAVEVIAQLRVELALGGVAPQQSRPPAHHAPPFAGAEDQPDGLGQLLPAALSASSAARPAAVRR